MSWKLKRVRQCEKCPWKVSTDPRDIPNGYCETKHRGLVSTIAEPAALPDGPMVSMACHEHNVSDGVHCVGWLHQQMTVGNNIGLRMMLLSCDNLDAVKVDGPQHETFEDTLPKN
jgi:hypothetical protein